MNDIRCKRCGKKLAEHKIEDGEVSILCNHRFEGGRCKTVNVFRVVRSREDNHNEQKHAIN